MLPRRTYIPRLLASRPIQQWGNAHKFRAISNSVPGQSAHQGQQSALPKFVVSSRSAFIRTTTFVETLADALTILRAVERKYGAINEYRFHKDFEVGTRYQTTLHVVFRDTESLERISSSTNVLRVAAPPIADEPGGIGLSDLEGLLGRQEFVEEADFPPIESVIDGVIQTKGNETLKSKKRFFDCQIRRSGTEYYTPSQNPVVGFRRNHMPNIARNFVNWGGFHRLNPIEEGTPMPDRDLFGTSDIDHLRMRRALRKWSHVGGISNPYEYSAVPKDLPQQASSSVAQQATLEWKPLPGYDSTLEDIPMPSVLEAVSPQSRSTENNPEASSSSVIPPPHISEKQEPSIPSPVQAPQNHHTNDLDGPMQRIPLKDLNSTGRDTSTRAAQLKAARKLIKKTHDGRMNGSKSKQPQEKTSNPESATKRNEGGPSRGDLKEKVDENAGITGRLKGFLGNIF